MFHCANTYTTCMYIMHGDPISNHVKGNIYMLLHMIHCTECLSYCHHLLLRWCCVYLLRSANKKQIIKAYRKLAREWHPDKFDGEDKAMAEKKFIDIAAAKEVLTDPGE